MALNSSITSSQIPPNISRSSILQTQTPTFPFSQMNRSEAEHFNQSPLLSLSNSMLENQILTHQNQFPNSLSANQIQSQQTNMFTTSASNPFVYFLIYRDSYWCKFRIVRIAHTSLHNGSGIELKSTVVLVLQLNGHSSTIVHYYQLSLPSTYLFVCAAMRHRCDDQILLSFYSMLYDTSSKDEYRISNLYVATNLSNLWNIWYIRTMFRCLSRIPTIF